MSSTCPPSESHLGANALGLAGFLGALWATVRWQIDPVQAVPLILAALAVPILLTDVLVHKVHRKPTTGIDWTTSRPPSWERVSTKLVGLAGAAALPLFVYFEAPEYALEKYQPFLDALWVWGPWAAVAAPLYFGFLDTRLVEPRDAYWHFGALLTGKRHEADLAKVADLLRGWAIKGFFIPLMYILLLGTLGGLSEKVASGVSHGAVSHLAGIVDLGFALTGYVLSLRIVDTHLRSAEPTFSGWLAAMICYPPINDGTIAKYIPLNTGHMWHEVLGDHPWALLYGVIVVGGFTVFSACTVQFGTRFSNLTNRGIVTNGLYRFTKHPAYISKLIVFTLEHMPFLYRGSWIKVARDCTHMALVGLVYVWRARTEEAHLSARDPQYVRYALWMNDHGMFAFLGRRLPFLQYKPPADQPRQPSTRE